MPACERERETEREGERDTGRGTFLIIAILTESLVGYLGNLDCMCYRAVLQCEMYVLLNKFLELILSNNWK